MMHFVFQAEHRTMTAFILAVIVNSYTTGQVSITAAPATSSLQEWHKGALFHTGPRAGMPPRPPFSQLCYSGSL
jgi:hypothetical protein